MLALSELEGEVHIMQTDTGQRSAFDAHTGVKVRGDLEMAPDQVLFLAWKQKQSPSLSDKKLRALWAAR